MSRQLVITLADDVYEELRRRAGQEDISHYIEQLVAPQTMTDDELEQGYRAMAADTEREQETLDWIESDPATVLP